jgi:hypothetical protein
MTYDLQRFANSIFQYLDHHALCPKLKSLAIGAYWEPKQVWMPLVTVYPAIASFEDTKPIFSIGGRRSRYPSQGIRCSKTSQSPIFWILIQIATGWVGYLDDSKSD